MTKLNDKKVLKSLQDKIEQAIDSVLPEDLKFEWGNARFERDGSLCAFKFELRAVADDGTDLAAKQEWDRHCTLFGLRPEDFNETFKVDGDYVTIVGIRPKAKRYPVLCRRGDGKLVAYTDSTVRRAFGRVTDAYKGPRGIVEEFKP